MKDLDRKIYSKTTNRALKAQLKNKQGVIIRKIKKLKVKLDNEKNKKQFILVWKLLARRKKCVC